MDNMQKYGFRWHVGMNGRPCPAPIREIVATGTSFDINGGASNIYLGPGDVVKKLTTGGVTLAEGAESAGGVADIGWGVVVAVGPYWDGKVMKPTNLLPSDIAWGTNLERQSTVWVVPLDQGYWEVDCDDKTTATTKAAYQAFISENVEWRNDTGASNTRAHPRIDISSHNPATATHALRIYGISDTAENEDFSGLYVKLIVGPNEMQRPWSSTTGV